MQSLSFRAMGSPCRVVVDDDHAWLLTDARDLVVRFEERWSRFLPTSETSAINANAGSVTIVSRQTFDLVARAVQAQILTDGRFNPLMLQQLRAIGYDRPWSQRFDERQRAPDEDGHPRPGAVEPIQLYPEINAVAIPSGTAFDPGGIGKGLAADFVTDHLVTAGATSSSVELGGDIRVSGEPWSDVVWRIGVADPFERTSDIAEVRPAGGAVATSSTLRRSWTSSGVRHHHLLEPTTGRSAVTDLVSVTACSTETWWAEIAAKVALISGSHDALDLLDQFGTPGIIVGTDGTVTATRGATNPINDHQPGGLVHS